MGSAFELKHSFWLWPVVTQMIVLLPSLQDELKWKTVSIEFFLITLAHTTST